MSLDLNRVVRGRVWKFGDSIETDAINPYYRYPTMEELKLHTMEAYRPEFPQEVKAGDILVAGRNFGCGSSRPGLVLREVGIAAIVAESVARLFLRNSIDRAIPIFIAPGITGIVNDGERAVWEKVYELGRSGPADLASALGAGESECEAVLDTLHRRRLVMRTDDGYIAVGGIGVRHD